MFSAILDTKRKVVVKVARVMTREQQTLLQLEFAYVHGFHPELSVKYVYAAIISKAHRPPARSIIAARKRKLRIRILAEIDASNARKANYLSRFVEIRRCRDLPFYLNIYDSRLVPFGPVFRPSDYQPHLQKRVRYLNR